MLFDAVPAPQVALQQVIGDVVGNPDLAIENLVVFYQDTAGDYSTLSSCCCEVHRVALMAAGLYQLEKTPISGSHQTETG